MICATTHDETRLFKIFHDILLRCRRVIVCGDFKSVIVGTVNSLLLVRCFLYCWYGVFFIVGTLNSLLLVR